MSDWNVGSAILILGVIYLHYAFGLELWMTIGFVLLGLLTWAYPGFRKERENLFKAQIRFYEAKTRFYEKKVEN